STGLASVIELRSGSSTAGLDVDNAFTHNGDLVFDQVGTSNVGADLTVTNVVHTGELFARNTGGGLTTDYHSLTGDFASSGSINVNSRLRLDGPNVDLSGAMIVVGAGGLLDFLTATVTIDAITGFSGAGAVTFSGSTILDVGASGGTLAVDVSSPGTLTINGTAPLTIAAGTTYTMSDDDVFAPLDIQGDIIIANGGNVITSVVGDDAAASWRLHTVGSATASLTLANGYVSTGTIIFDQTGSAANAGSDLIVTAGELENAGTWILRDTGGGMTSDLHSINGNIRNSGDLLLTSRLQVTGAFVNEGTVEVDSPVAVDTGTVLQVNGAPGFNNDGLFAVSDSAGSMTTAFHTFNGLFTQGVSGLIDVNGRLQINASTLDLAVGSINVAEDNLLSINNATVLLGEDSRFTGTGTIELIGASSIDVDGNFTVTEQTPFLDLSGGAFEIGTATTSSDTITIAGQGMLVLESNTVHEDLQVDGDLVVHGTTDLQAQSELRVSVNGVVTIEASSAGNVQLTDTGTLDADGLIVLDQVDGSDNFATLNMPSGSLLLDGTLEARDSGGGLTTNYHVVDADITAIFGGLIAVYDRLNIDQSTVDLQNTSTIFVDENAELLLSDVNLSIDSPLLGTGTIEIAGTNTLTLRTDLAVDEGVPSLDFSGGQITIDATYTQSVTINPGATLTLVDDDVVNVPINNMGILQITGTGGPATQIDAGAFSNQDRLVLNSGAFSANLSLQSETFTNTGTIRLNNTGATANGSGLSLDPTGTNSTTFNNPGLIESVDTSAGMGAGDFHTITTPDDFINGGELDVQQSLSVVAPTFTNVGTVTLHDMTTLSLTTASNVTNNGVIRGSGT
ncbi:MAG: hypothetical protein AAF525_21750, partial [Pseudomonadota bacterium]